MELGAGTDARKNPRLTRQELFSAELSGVGLGGRPESQLGEPRSEGRLECGTEVELLDCEVFLGEDDRQAAG